MYHSSTALIEALHDIIDERVAEQIECLRQKLIDEVLSSVEPFDINDYQGEIEDMIDEKVKEMTFTVTVD